MTTDLEERCVLWMRMAQTGSLGSISSIEKAANTAAGLNSPAPGGAFWLPRMRRAAHVSGGHVELCVGSSLLVSFDGIDLEDAVDFARSVLEIARECVPQVVARAGLALGEVTRARANDGDTPTWVGDAFDRAQTLCQHARAFEIVFDEAAEQRGREPWLFSREFCVEPLHGNGPSALRGFALELEHFSKRACRAALSRLRPLPLPASALPALTQLRAYGVEPGQIRVVLRAQTQETASLCVERLLAGQTATLCLSLSSAAGSLRPLGSLAFGLSCLWGLASARDPWAEEQGTSEPTYRFSAPPPETRDTFDAVLRGRAVARDEVLHALHCLLTQYTGDARPWIVLHAPAEIDPASLGVLADVLQDPELDVFVLIALPSDGELPSQLLPSGTREGLASNEPRSVPPDDTHTSPERSDREIPLQELSLPELPLEDRVTIAQSVLSLAAEDDIAQHIAAVGGTHLHSLTETIRTWVSAGDLVWERDHFAWRRGPRPSDGEIGRDMSLSSAAGSRSSPDLLIAQRIAGLDSTAYRLLEIACSCPRQTSLTLLQRVAERDGLRTGEWRVGLETLRAEGWLDSALTLGAADAMVRAVMRKLMPPPRTLELHRFVAELLRQDTPSTCFASGEIAYHLQEAGHTPAAANALLEAAHAAVETGFTRMALRLLATAVQWDPSTQTRITARQISRTAAQRRTITSASTDAQKGLDLPAPQANRPASLERPHRQHQENAEADSAMQSALRALMDEDFEAVEPSLAAARAAGSGRHATQRVLALAHALRGDVEAAAAALAPNAQGAAPDSVRARDSLCQALVELSADDAHSAVRQALTALSLARKHADARGETACLRVLALVYRALHRGEDAARLDALAQSRAGTLQVMS